jgi:hypothetical protein
MKLTFSILLAIFSSQLMANQICSVHLENKDLSKRQMKNVRTLIKKLNFVEVKASEHANYRMEFEKDSFINIHGYPAFFMTQYTVDLYENGYLSYESHANGRYPGLGSLKRLMNNIEKDVTFCPNPNPSDFWL